MRKNLFYAGALMASMVFTACNNDDAPFKGEELAADGQQLSIVLNPAGNNSRAGRPLLSSAAMQAIDNVTLYVVKNGTNKVVLKKVVGEGAWQNAVDYSTNGHGKEVLVTFKASDNQALTENEVYTIYAVGYTKTNKSAYKFTPETPDKIEYATVNEVGHVDWSDFQASLSDAKVTIGEEVFAGSIEVKVVKEEADSDKAKLVLKAKGEGSEYNADPDLMLFRQVAGVTGYFTSIPVNPLKNGEHETRYVRLVSSNINKTVLFADLNNASATTQEANNAKAVMNGKDKMVTKTAEFKDGTPGYEVYTIDLHEFYQVKENTAGENEEPTKYSKLSHFDLNNDGYLNHEDVKKYISDNKNVNSWTEDQVNNPTPNMYKDFWRNPRNWEKGTTEKPYYHVQRLVIGSVWGAEFLIPFEHTGHRTMELQLLDEEKNILTEFNVNIPTADLVKDPSAAGGQDQATATVLNTVYDINESIFNVYRNHMYSLGEKAVDTTPDPTDPENPDPTDPDKPVDPTDPEEKPDPENPQELKPGQALLIKVNDNWEIIHNMEID